VTCGPLRRVSRQVPLTPRPRGDVRETHNPQVNGFTEMAGDGGTGPVNDTINVSSGNPMNPTATCHDVDTHDTARNTFSPVPIFEVQDASVIALEDEKSMKFGGRSESPKAVTSCHDYICTRRRGLFIFQHH
jgi:hypothetical protein